MREQGGRRHLARNNAALEKWGGMQARTVLIASLPNRFGPTAQNTRVLDGGRQAERR
jgi:hypothetical protein